MRDIFHRIINWFGIEFKNINPFKPERIEFKPLDYDFQAHAQNRKVNPLNIPGCGMRKGTVLVKAKK